VLVGDFIYTRAFQLMTQLNSLKILQIMSEATNVIAEGEVQQLMNICDPNTTEENYMRVIYSKTARLFEASTQTAAIVANATAEQELALQDYGRYLGTAFQLVDDVLDYSANAIQLGKNVGDDLAEGKPTLPLLHAMHHGNETQAQLIRKTIEQGGNRDVLDEVLAIMNEYQSLDYAMARAKQEAQKAVDAIQILPENEYKRALISLAYLSVSRSY
jgi:octaprenyl-diphosphate synthase